MKKIYLIAAVVALVAGVATYFFANELKTSKIVTGVDEETVYIALMDIDENMLVIESMFEKVKMPASYVSYGSVSNIKDVIGYMTTSKICKGEQLMLSRIVPIAHNPDKYKLSYQLEQGMYAYSVSIGIENGVSYFIKENDKVNIYDVRNPSAEPLLENVRVLRISDYSANIQQELGTDITSYLVMTLELSKEQIAKMMTVDTPASPAGQGDEFFRAVLVSHVEAYELEDDIANAKIPENQNPEPQTNNGMGEIVPAPLTTEIDS